MSPAWRMPSNSMKTLWPARSEGSLKCLRYHESPLYVPRSPPPCAMIMRKESTSLKLCGVATAVHLESSKAVDLWASLYQKRATDADRLLEQLGLTDKRDAWFMNLSGGQKQRL